MNEDFLRHPQFNEKSIIMLLCGLAVVLFTFNFLIKGDPEVTVTEDTVSNVPFSIEPVTSIWPAAASKPLIDQDIEYRPSTTPGVQDTYCVHEYKGGDYVYQYIGQTKHGQPGPTCQ